MLLFGHIVAEDVEDLMSNARVGLSEAPTCMDETSDTDSNATTLSRPKATSVDGESLSEDEVQLAVIDTERTLISMAIELKPYLRCVAVRGDGNCQFRAIAFHTIGEEFHGLVRQACVDEVLANQDRYSSYMAVSIEVWSSTMERDTHWGDAISLRAASNAYNRPLVIFRKHFPEQLPAVFMPENYSLENPRQEIYLNFEEPSPGCEHFEPLEVGPSPQKKPLAIKTPKKRVSCKRNADAMFGTAAETDSPPPVQPVAFPTVAIGHSIADKSSVPEATIFDDESHKMEPKIDPIQSVGSKGKQLEDLLEEPPQKRRKFHRLKHASEKVCSDGKASAKSETDHASEKVCSDNEDSPKSMTDRSSEKVCPDKEASAKSMTHRSPEVPVQPDKASLVDGNFLEGGIMVRLQESGICAKCGDEVLRSNAKLSGKQQQCWVCKTCHSRSTQLNKLYGAWPPKQFQLMTAEAKKDFWKSAQEHSNSKNLKLFTEETMTVSKTDEKGVQNFGDYLPLGRWETLGFDAKEIVANCNDTMRHPILGLCYCVKISSKWDKQREEQTQAENTIVREPPPTIASTAKGNAQTPKKSPEEKSADKEALREEKARATQEARDTKNQSTLANKYLRRVVKVAFNVASILSLKSTKKLGDDTRKAADTLKTDLKALEKSLQSIVFGKKSSEPIDVDNVEKLIAKGEEWHAQMLNNVTMLSLTI